MPSDRKDDGQADGDPPHEELCCPACGSKLIVVKIVLEMPRAAPPAA